MTWSADQLTPTVLHARGATSGATAPVRGTKGPSSRSAVHPPIPSSGYSALGGAAKHQGRARGVEAAAVPDRPAAGDIRGRALITPFDRYTRSSERTFRAKDTLGSCPRPSSADWRAGPWSTGS